MVYESVDDGYNFIIRSFNGTAEETENVDRADVIGKPVTEVFPKAENLLGYKSEELLQKNFSDLFVKADRPNLKEQLEEDGFFYRGEQPVEKKDGSKIITSMSSSLVEFHGKKTILTLFQDMTKRVQLEEELGKELRA